MSNELSTPKVVVCPSDDGHSAHTNFNIGTITTSPGTPSASQAANLFSNTKISWFVGVDASDNNPQMFLAGDRNIYGQTGVGTIVSPFPNQGFGNGPDTMVVMGTN